MPERKPSLILIPDRKHVSWNGQTRPIKFIGTFPSEVDDYSDSPYIFLDKFAEQANGVVVEMQAHAATKVLEVKHPEVQFHDIAIQGSGWFLGISPDGNLITQEVGLHLGEENNPVLEYGAGWTFCWIAGDEGLEILDVTIPPFKPDMELEVEQYSDQLPEEFWQKFDELKGSSLFERQINLNPSSP